MKPHLYSITALSILFFSCGQPPATTTATTTDTTAISTDTAQVRNADDALAALQAGNERFVAGKMVNTNYKTQIDKTKDGQKPHTIVLSCMDSRVPPEIVFDQGIGNLFVTRVAGNIADANILGSMEYATKVVGSKLIVVMGHNHCGAVKGAIADVQLGNLTQLLTQIKPAISHDTADHDKQIDETAKNNIKMTIDYILKNSEVINTLVQQGAVKIKGAYYDIETGKVSFID